MQKITGISVEHDDQSVFGTDVFADDASEAFDNAMSVLRMEVKTSPGKVTRVWFSYADDDE
jgi:hypothetical protein